jgi:hypothetical protein
MIKKSAIFRALNWHSMCLSATNRQDHKSAKQCAKLRDTCLRKAGFDSYSQLFQQVFK